MTNKLQKRIQRHKRVRARIKGTSKVPRLCVFRSNRHIYVQLIDDAKRETIAQVKDDVLPLKNKKSSIKAIKQKDVSLKEGKEAKELALKGKIALAYQVGELIAKLAKEKNIKKAVFDRGGYKYHGRVKAVADGARKGGLQI